MFYGPASSLKAIRLFIHGLLPLAAITLAVERGRKCLSETTKKGSFVDFKKRDLVRAPDVGVKSGFMLPEPLRSDSKVGFAASNI